MNDNISNGTFFENWFAENLPSEFKIVSNPPEYSNTYNKENLRPDFLIEHIKTGKQFYIECKYRSLIPRLRKVDILCDHFCLDQLTRYENYHTDTYYLIGIFKKQDLKELYLIPFWELKSVMSFNESKMYKQESLKINTQYLLD